MALISMHSCSLDARIKLNLGPFLNIFHFTILLKKIDSFSYFFFLDSEAQIVEKPSDPPKKKPTTTTTTTDRYSSLSLRCCVRNHFWV